MPTFAVIIPAAGQGTRFLGDQKPSVTGYAAKKPFVSLRGKPVWLHAAARFAEIPEVVQIILVVAPEDIEEVRREFAGETARFHVETVGGGSERFESVENGLALVQDDVDYVAIHDAARPCVTRRIIDSVFRAAVESGAAIPASPVVGTIKRAAVSETSGGAAAPIVIDRTESRERLWEAQTPQVFRKDLYCEAVRRRGGFTPTDDAGLLERIGVPVRIVPADRTNLKITTPLDLTLAEKFLEIQDQENNKTWDHLRIK